MLETVKDQIVRVHEAVPGRQMRQSLVKRAFPPAWLWIKFGIFQFGAVFLYVLDLSLYANILFMISIVQIISYPLTIFCQELANAIKRFSEARKRAKAAEEQAIADEAS